MTASAVTVDPLQRVGVSRNVQPTPFHELSTVVNQPLANVWEHLCSVTSGKAGSTVESDPTLETVHLSWERRVSVRYTGYEVPGGAQVVAAIESQGQSRFDPVTGIAVHSVGRRIATELAKMRKHLE